jgi:carbonic anhydrase
MLQTCKHSIAHFFSFSIFMVSACIGQENHPQHAWDYGKELGPSHWGDLRPEFATCKNGHLQSPIDIRNPQKVSLAAINFEYKPSPSHIIDKWTHDHGQLRLGQLRHSEREEVCT